MELQYAATDQLALQRYSTEQLLAATGPGDTTGGRPDWAVLGIIAVHRHAMHQAGRRDRPMLMVRACKWEGGVVGCNTEVARRFWVPARALAKPIAR